MNPLPNTAHDTARESTSDTASESSSHTAPDTDRTLTNAVPDPNAVPAREAATVALLRDGVDGIETWMMRRTQTMRFSPGAMVFPGGKVDPSDDDGDVVWQESHVSACVERMAVPASQARAVLHAAVRELFEETGLLLADPPPSGDLESARRAVETRELPLRAVLTEHGGAIDIGTLRPWARWVTPPGNPLRYDAWFFVARMPHGSELRAVGTEADAAGWVRVDAALESARRGETVLVPSTQAVLTSIAAAGSVDAVFDRAPGRSIAPVHPNVRDLGDGTSEISAGDDVFLWSPAEHVTATDADLSHLFVRD